VLTTQHVTVGVACCVLHMLHIEFVACCVLRVACWVLLGAWCVVRGAWCVVRGAWCVVRGAWCVARGAWRVFDVGAWWIYVLSAS
jgi:hypothetical protein